MFFSWCDCSYRKDANPKVFPKYIRRRRNGIVLQFEASEGILPQHKYNSGLWSMYDGDSSWQAHVHQGKVYTVKLKIALTVV